MSSLARRLLSRPRPARSLVGGPLERLEGREVPATLVTLAADGTSALNAPVDVLATSDDGRYVLFQTKATNVVGGQVDPQGTLDLFWRDTSAQRTELLSGRDPTATGAGGPRSVTLGVEASSPGNFLNAVMSGDGQTVAFLSGGNASRYDTSLAGATDDGGNDVFRWTAGDDRVRLASIDRAGFACGTYSVVTNPGISGAGNAIGFVSTATPDIRFDSKFISGKKSGAILREPPGPNLFVKFGDDLPRLVSYNGDNIQGRNKLDPMDTSADFWYPYADVSVDPLGRYISDQGFTFIIMRDYRNNQTLTASGSYAPGYALPFVSDGTFFGGQLINTNLLTGGNGSNSQLNRDAYRFSFAGVGIDPPRALVQDLLSYGATTFKDTTTGQLVTGTDFFGTGTTGTTFQQGVSQVGTVTNAFVARDRGDVAVYATRIDPQITATTSSQFFFGTTPTAPTTYDVTFAPVAGYQNNSPDRTDLFLARFTAGQTGFQYTSTLVTGSNGSATVGQGLAGATDATKRGSLDTSGRGFSITSDGTKVSYATAATDVLAGVTDRNRARDVFQFFSVTGETKLVSVSATAPSFTATGDSYNPLMTQDGQLVAFESTAADLVVDRVNNRAPDTNGVSDIFVRDVASKVTTEASLIPGNGAAGNGKSFNPVVGGTFVNGKVYYTSAATNLDQTLPLPAGTPQQGFGTGLPLLLPQQPRFTAFSGGGGTVTFAVTSPRLDGSFDTLRTVQPFGKNYTGELRVATGDFNGDGTLDVIVGAGPGGGPRVAVLDGATGRTLTDFFAFESRFLGGVYVALGDLTGDGKADIIVGAGEGGGPRVQVTDAATNKTYMDAFVYEAQFRGGARVAAGDVTGDGRVDLVTGAGIGGGPRITVFDGTRLPDLTNAYANFYAFEPTLRGGAYVSVGDFDGDGKADIATGAGPDGGPRVVVFDAANIVTFDPNKRDRFVDFFAFDPDSRNGARPVIKDIDGDGVSDLVVGSGNGFPLIRTFAGGRKGPAAENDPQPFSILNPITGGISLSGAWVG